MTGKNPNWRLLALISIFSIFVLVGEVVLPFSQAIDSWFLIIWVLVFYGIVGTWVTRERNALEQQPAPRDCIGRRIMEPDEVEIPEPASKRSNVPFATRPVHRRTTGNVEC